MSLHPTRVVTFYSFKGGVGRTMAVVNVAEALASWGRNVLVLEMDLEAPGLSGFYRRNGAPQAPSDIIGLLTWAIANRATAEEGSPLGAFASPAGRQPGRLDVILTREDNDYFNRLSELGLGRLDREDLAATSRTLRRYLCARRFDVEVPPHHGPDAPVDRSYDYVLVDSRTGATETGGLNTLASQAPRALLVRWMRTS